MDSSLLKLPPELRLPVYEPLIAAGDLNILRTNKLIHREATDVLKSKAILRMNFDRNRPPSRASFPLTGSLNLTGTLTYHAPVDIQRIEFHYWVHEDYGKSRYFDEYTHLIKAFGGREILRESCAIFLHLKPGCRIPGWYNFYSEAAWKAIVDLTGFKTLTVMIWRDGHLPFQNPYPSWARWAEDSRLMAEAERPHGLLLESYETVRDLWKHSLGPAVLDESIEGYCLKFYPSEYKPKLAGGYFRAMDESLSHFSYLPYGSLFLRSLKFQTHLQGLFHYENKVTAEKRERPKTMQSTGNDSSTPIMYNEKSVIVENNLLLQPSKQKIFPILQLPRELRDIIYQHSIAAGNLTILRINKSVHEEASQLLPKHAILRVNLGFTDRTNWQHLCSQSLDFVQRAELRLKIGQGAIRFKTDVIRDLLDDQITRESCVVTVHCGMEGSAPYSYFHTGLYLQVARLRGFKSLVVKIEMKSCETDDFNGLFARGQFRSILAYEPSLPEHHEIDYVRVRNYLQVGLGPAKFDNSVEGHHLEFHPLEPDPEDWKHEHGFEDYEYD